MAIAGIREASRLIFVDELTGLYNRRFMRQYLRERLDQLTRERSSLAVIMLDLDGFKQINDTYGHLEGDLVLKRVAEIVREALPPGGYAIRFAGDEFFAFLEGTDGAGGVRVAETIRERVSADSFATPKAPTGISVRLSLGVAAYPEDAAAPSQLIEAADQALYRSKRMGKNCVSRAGGWTLPSEAEIFKRFPCPRLVGREGELSQLEQPLLNEALRKNRLFLVEASRGVGKTRLLLELQARAVNRGLRCLFTRCLHSNQAIPYSTLKEALSDYLGRATEHQDAIRRRLSAPTVAEIGTLIPALATADPPRQPLAPEDRRSLLFHAMEDLLCLLSEGAPLVLFLDDLHFVDEASLEVLYRLLDREEGRVIVYAATQSEGLAKQEGTPGPLQRLFALLRQSPSLARLSLPSLTPSQVAQMVTEILVNSEGSPAFFERLYEASRGIPLFVEETLKGLIAKGALQSPQGIWNLDAVEPEAVPATLEAAILGGLETLDQETQTMITRAAVVGPHVDLSLLSGVLGKDAGETLALVDQGKKHRVFEDPGPLGDDDEVRFLSQCFQQVVYYHLDPNDRQRTHRVVGEVTERLAGPLVDEALGPLAYHFERSDDPAKADFYRRRVQEFSGQLFSADELARELSLKVGTTETTLALDERTWPLADRFLRALTVAVKNMRVYPEGSQLVTDGWASVSGAIGELLARVEAVTLAEESQSLQLNGRTVESKGLLPFAQELLRTYADHGIRRCTFERGATQADVLGFLKILSGPPEGIQHDVAFWEQRLKSAKIAHVRVFPVIYLAATEGRTIWRREQKEVELDDPTLVLVRDALRVLATSVDNIRLYPPESQLITHTLDQLERQMQTLLTRIPSLTLAMAEGALVVNATRPNPRLFGITIEILHRLMEDSGLTSLTIRRGVTREELRLFLTHLAQPVEEEQRAPTFWRSVLEGRGISTIEVGTRLYAAATRLEQAKTAEPEAPPEEGPRPPGQMEVSETEPTLRRAAELLGEPLANFLERRIQEELPALIQALKRREREDLARQLVERTASGLGQADGTLRRKAAEGLALCLREAQEEAVTWLLSVMTEPLATALGKERELEAFQVEVKVVSAGLKHFLVAGDLSRAARLAEGLAGTSERGPDPGKFLESVKGLVDSLAAVGALEPVLMALKDRDPIRRQQGSAILSGLGAAAVPMLLGLIFDGADEEVSRAAATLVRAQGEASVRLLTDELHRSESIERLCRIVAVIDLLVPALGNEFLFLLGHPEAEVRAETGRTLTRLGRDQAMRFLGQALSQRKSDVLVGALECVRGLQGVELLDAVLRILDNPANDHVLRVACLCLGKLKDTRAIGPLLQILGQRPRFFGLKKGLPEGVRATAARALGELAIPEAKLGLQVALKERNKTVRSAARLALLRLEQELEARPKA